MIRKQILEEPTARQGKWLDVGSLARFEITSEDPAHPIDNALKEGGKGWRAGADGPQAIRMTFDSPQSISKIIVLFEENDSARTQEFTISWCASGSAEWREIVRQQFNFSPPGTSKEREEFNIPLKDAIGIELRIIPNMSGNGRASLRELLIG
ncbi:MAG TPA: discoidin domain-containing protein [Terrimicrobium sp.]